MKGAGLAEVLARRPSLCRLKLTIGQATVIDGDTIEIWR
jgi:hypothetical protein